MALKAIKKEPDNRVFGFYKARQALDVNQKVVADALGMHRSEYSYLESLTYDQVDDLMKLLGMSEASLFCPR